jgi:predicted  nucleic acid-binding Zn-ribbon protein
MAASPETAALKAEINDLRRQLQTTDHRLVGREQAEAAQKLQTIENQVATFASEKPDFEELADDVEEQVLALKAKQPHLDPAETLQKAYERARRINPTVAARLDAEQKANAEKERLEAVKKRATEAKRAAPLSVASTPSNSHNPRSVDDTLRDVARKAYRR